MAEPLDSRSTALIEAEPVTDAGTADSIRDEIRDFANLGGFKLQPGFTPWHGAALHTAEQAHHAADLAARLHSHLLPLLAYRVGQACTRAGLREPGNHRERTERLRLFAGVAQTMRLLSPRVFEAGPARLAEATGEGGPAGRRERYPGRRKRHALRERARALWLGAGNPERGDLHAALARAAEQLAEWNTLGEGPPWPPRDLGDLLRLQAECEAHLASLRAYVHVPDDPDEVLAAICADRDEVLAAICADRDIAS